MNEKGSSTLKICFKKLKLINYSEHTIKIYLHYINEFILKQNKSTKHLNSEDFQSYLDNYNFTSISQQNQIINAIRFLYKEVLNRKYDKVSFKRPFKEKKLPKVIDSEIILNKLSKIENLKHKTILSLCYSVGLRVSEIVNLKIEDIDSKRMLINIINGKGKKDRIVPLSENILIILRDYYKQYKPKIYLFNGQNGEKYSIQSCQQIYKKYIDSKTSIHNLRHSCFTTLLESGVDIKVISNIAGHSNVKTTEIYTHVTTNILKKVKLPL
jgi:site-specific recombinase XerD